MAVIKQNLTKIWSRSFLEKGFEPFNNMGRTAVTIVQTIAKVSNLNHAFCLSLIKGKKYARDKMNKGKR
jgi:hypothetical protein